MLTDEGVPDVEAVNDLLMRLDDLSGEVESGRTEFRAIHPGELPGQRPSLAAKVPESSSAYNR
jgi:hypothetical protein